MKQGKLVRRFFCYFVNYVECKIKALGIFEVYRKQSAFGILFRHYILVADKRYFFGRGSYLFLLRSGRLRIFQSSSVRVCDYGYELTVLAAGCYHAVRFAAVVVYRVPGIENLLMTVYIHLERA